MQPTSRLMVLSDRIPRVLLFIYFCRGLSGIMEERPTRRDYIEILTGHMIFYHLEGSRSHGNKRGAERRRAQGARPVAWGARPLLSANRLQLRGSCSTDLWDQGKPHDLSRLDPTAKIHLEGLYKWSPWTLEEEPLDPGGGALEPPHQLDL